MGQLRKPKGSFDLNHGGGAELESQTIRQMLYRAGQNACSSLVRRQMDSCGGLVWLHPPAKPWICSEMKEQQGAGTCPHSRECSQQYAATLQGKRSSPWSLVS